MSEKGIIVILLAVVIGLAGFIVLAAPQQAQAGGGGGENKIIVVTGNINNGQEDVLYFVDTERKTIMLYRVTNNIMNLKCVRHYAFDIQLIQYPGKKQKPSVKEIRSLIKKGR